MKADSPIKTCKDATASNTIAYSTNGSSSNNIVVAFGQELGVKAKPTATGGPPGDADAGDDRADRHRLGGAAVRPEGDQGRQDPHHRARQRRALAARARRCASIIVNANALKEKHDAIMRFVQRLSRGGGLDVRRSEGARDVFRSR